MSPLRYLLASLRHYWFAYLGVLCGAVLGATVLLGALFAGDSVKASLRRIAENRIGRATHAISGGDRFFRAALADDVARATRQQTAPVLHARGVATSGSVQASLGHVQLIGVTDSFWQLAPTPPASAPLRAEGSATPAAINATLAFRLHLEPGDTIIVRLQKPGILAGNAPVAGAESSLQSVRCRITAVLDDAAFGRFSLESTQVPAPSVFLPIAALQDAISQPGRANLILVQAEGSVANLGPSLASAVQLDDYGLRLRWLEKAAAFELSSARVFIDPPVADAITATVTDAQPVVSYLVNEFRVRDRATPYSIAAATSPHAAPFLPRDLGANEIVLNQWLADDLEARTGDDLKLTYFQTGPAGAIVERDATFRVRSIVALEGLAADRAWMPEFPGITDTQHQSDWNPGLPLKLDRIRDKDERYWDDYRGAPKAFLSIAGGRSVWSTRWGNTTALRFAWSREREQELTSRLLGALRPEMAQVQIRNVRATAEQAAQSPVDFAGLFIGMSFFLIVAALGLVAMLFQFALLQRNREDALLGAIGLPARKIRRWRLREAAAILLIGALGGGALATIYTRGILRLLDAIWAGQASESTFVFSAQPASLAGGVLGFWLLSLAALWFAIRKQMRRALSIRLTAHSEEIGPLPRIRRTSQVVVIVAVLIALGVLGASGRGLPAQIAFYLAGFALLAAGVAFCRRRLATPLPPHVTGRPDAARLGALNVRARRSRSLTVVGLIATAVFMVLSVASFRKNVGDDWLERRSGTGGFALWIETTTPINPARDGRGGFEIFDRAAKELGDVVALRLGAGDNANCFNLNSTGQPRLLAVDSKTFAKRNAFAPKVARLGRGGTKSSADTRTSLLFRAGPPTSGEQSGWPLLSTVTADGAIPALVDETTLLWALKRKVGDTLTYPDETGRPFTVQIIGTLRDSLFQGYVLVDEQRFLEKFPSHAGYGAFLVDVRDPAQIEAVQTQLASATRDDGGRVELTRDVLGAFHQIENTYISIFNVLGSLGVILGSLGLAIVVARNLRERRGEFAIMTAMGIPRSILAQMVFAEFGRLVAWGIGIGVVSSAIAVWPNLATLPATATFLLVGALLAGIVGLNLLSGWLIFRWSTRDLRPSVVLEAA